ncbi:ribbon-helix-helix domain-containing protein [Natrinema sp. 1APR25-10V2]|uniref:ribbon-helix-helix domain-containing protein n=1 Tax=Natrinema sp. 1APR25-10V2 TaxID=2951081 RepID=UPI0028761D91|nr:ribbon-helix-helix domain-containing protein [Natrinema sp. 1APR25-10V2]MDS0474207.1 ribbon-helix-helix domain-containing protein [Natrinema sp. 1APR25-10V2]
MTESRSPPADGTPEHNRSRLENGPTLDRVTFRATDEQLAAIESLVDDDVYRNRSEVIRAGIQRLLEHHAETDAGRDDR